MIAAAASFLFSPLGRIVGIGLVVLFVAGGIWKSGYNYASRKCEAAALHAKLEAARIDKEAAEAAAAEAEKARAESDKIAAEERKKVDEYADELRKRPMGGCALGDDDLKRLRGNAR